MNKEHKHKHITFTYFFDFSTIFYTLVAIHSINFNPLRNGGRGVVQFNPLQLFDFY